MSAKGGDSPVPMATTSRRIKKTKYPEDIEAERKFTALKQKYANAIAFLLVNNIPRGDLQGYFSANE